MKKIFNSLVCLITTAAMLFCIAVCCIGAGVNYINVYEVTSQGVRYSIADRLSIPILYEGSKLLIDADTASGNTLTVRLCSKDGSLISQKENTSGIYLTQTELDSCGYLEATLTSGDEVLDSITMAKQDKARLSSAGVIATTVSDSAHETAANHPQLLMNSALITPNYKGLIFEENGTNDIQLEIHVDNSAISDENFIIASITDFNKDIVREVTCEQISAKMFAVFSSGELSLGDHTLTLKLVRKSDGAVLDRDLHPLRKRKGSFDSFSSYVNQDGILIKDGKPHFAVGIYSPGYTTDSSAIENQFASISQDNSIDFCMSYWQGMDGVYSPDWYSALASHGLDNAANARVFYENASGDRINFGLTGTADEGLRLEDWVKKQREYSNLEMYYVGDEEGPGYNDKLRWHSDIISSHDITRPTLYVDWRASEENAFMRTNAADIMGIDYYPIDSDADAIAAVGSRLANVRKGFRNRPVYMVIQCANQDYINGNTNHSGTCIMPTYEHMLNMAVQSVCSGATGIMWYSYYNIMDDVFYTQEEREAALADVRSVSAVIKSYEDIIMSTQEVPDITASFASGSSGLSYTLKRLNGKTYIFAANTTSSAQTAMFFLSGAASAVDILNDDKYDIDVSADSVSAYMPPLGCAVIEVDHGSFKSSDNTLHCFTITSKDGNPVIYSLNDNGDINAVVTGRRQNLSYEAVVHPEASFEINGIKQNLGDIASSRSQITVTAPNGDTSSFNLICSFSEEPPVEAVSSNVYTVDCGFYKISEVCQCTSVESFLAQIREEGDYSVVGIYQNGIRQESGFVADKSVLRLTDGAYVLDYEINVTDDITYTSGIGFPLPQTLKSDGSAGDLRVKVTLTVSENGKNFYLLGTHNENPMLKVIGSTGQVFFFTESISTDKLCLTRGKTYNFEFVLNMKTKRAVLYCNKIFVHETTSGIIEYKVLSFNKDYTALRAYSSTMSDNKSTVTVGLINDAAKYEASKKQNSIYAVLNDDGSIKANAFSDCDARLFAVSYLSDISLESCKVYDVKSDGSAEVTISASEYDAQKYKLMLTGNNLRPIDFLDLMAK